MGRDSLALWVDSSHGRKKQSTSCNVLLSERLLVGCRRGHALVATKREILSLVVPVGAWRDSGDTKQ